MCPLCLAVKTISSEQFEEIVAGKLRVSQNLSKESTPDCLTMVYRYNRTAAIWMMKETMAALGTNNFKSYFLQGFDKSGTGN
jgi:hypothetical protein